MRVDLVSDDLKHGLAADWPWVPDVDDLVSIDHPAGLQSNYRVRQRHWRSSSDGSFVGVQLLLDRI